MGFPCLRECMSSANSTAWIIFKIILSAFFSSSTFNKPVYCFLNLKHIQYAMILSNLLKDECLRKIFTFKVVVVRHTIFLASGNSFTVLSLNFGQSDTLCLIQWGPLNHSEFFTKSCGSWPLDIASAGLSTDLTWRHRSEFDWLAISATRLATSVFNRCGGVLIQCNAMVESVHKTIFSSEILRVDLIYVTIWESNCAPHNSRRGSDIVFKGATRDFVNSNFEGMWFLESVDLR